MWFNKMILLSKCIYSKEDIKRLVIEKVTHGDKKQLAKSEGLQQTNKVLASQYAKPLKGLQI
jgi:hypothetical protein